MNIGQMPVMVYDSTIGIELVTKIEEMTFLTHVEEYSNRLFGLLTSS
jgi:hypothetical protein